MLSLILAALVQASPGPPDALKYSFEMRAAWEICATLHATNYATLTDSSEVLADAALAKCAVGESQFNAAMKRIVIDERGRGFDQEHLDLIARDERAKIRAVALTTILDARLKSQRAKK